MRYRIWNNFLVCFCLISLSSCFSKYFYTDKEIKKHYEKKDFKPKFHLLNYEKKKLHYVEFGDSTKPILILIHGAPGAWYTWMNFADNDSLRAHFQILIVDRLGYGKSNYGKAEKDINKQINSIQFILDQYPNKELYVAGRSYGAPIAAVLAANNSSKCHHLYLYSPVLSPYIEKKYWFSGLGKVFFIKWMLPKAFNVATTEKFAHLVQMKSLLVYYPQIKASTVIVAGKKDWVAHPTNFKICDSLITNAPKKNILIAEGDHFLTLKCPQTMAKIIYKPFLSLDEALLKSEAKLELEHQTKREKK